MGRRLSLLLSRVGLSSLVALLTVIFVVACLHYHLFLKVEGLVLLHVLENVVVGVSVELLLPFLQSFFQRIFPLQGSLTVFLRLLVEQKLRLPFQLSITLTLILPVEPTVDFSLTHELFLFGQIMRFRVILHGHQIDLFLIQLLQLQSLHFLLL